VSTIAGLYDIASTISHAQIHASMSAPVLILKNILSRHKPIAGPDLNDRWWRRYGHGRRAPPGQQGVWSSSPRRPCRPRCLLVVAGERRWATAYCGVGVEKLLCGTAPGNSVRGRCRGLGGCPLAARDNEGARSMRTFLFLSALFMGTPRKCEDNKSCCTESES